jgi:hypothetical protein
MLQLRTWFEHLDHVRKHPNFGTLKTISYLCRRLVTISHFGTLFIVYNTYKVFFFSYEQTTLHNKMEVHFIDQMMP